MARILEVREADSVAELDRFSIAPVRASISDIPSRGSRMGLSGSLFSSAETRLVSGLVR